MLFAAVKGAHVRASNAESMLNMGNWWKMCHELNILSVIICNRICICIIFVFLSSSVFVFVYLYLRLMGSVSVC